MDETAATTDAGAPNRRRQIMMMILVGFVIVLLAALVYLMVSRSGAAADVMSGVDEDTVQAVYLSNDRVFFGDLEAKSGDWVALRDAVYLRRSAAAAAEDAEEGAEAPAASTDLVPFEQEVGGDGDMLINAREIVLVQNLDDRSEIATALGARRD